MKEQPWRFRTAVALLAIGCVVAGARLSAHDMWIEPGTFAPASGEIVAIRLRVGQDLLGDPLPRDSRLIDQFVVDDREGRKPVVGRDGGDPAGFVRAAVPGLMIVGYHSHPSVVDLPAGTFNQYLKDEGLDEVAAARAKRGETAAPARELFARCAKSLVESGPAIARQGDRVLGFPLELIADSNPYALRPGRDLGVQLLYDGRPLSGALVVALNRSNPQEKLSARSGTDGRVRLPVRGPGMWLVKAVHMIPAPAGSGAQWESFWASLTFELHPGAAKRVER